MSAAAGLAVALAFAVLFVAGFALLAGAGAPRCPKCGQARSRWHGEAQSGEIRRCRACGEWFVIPRSLFRRQ